MNTTVHIKDSLVESGIDLHRVLGLAKDDVYDASPGCTAFFSQFSALFQALGSLALAIKTRNRGQIAEHSVRVLNLPFGIASSIDRFARFSTILLTGASIATISVAGTVCGFIFLAVQLCLEASRIIQILRFNNTYSIKKVDLKDDEKVSEAADRIFREHFLLADKNEQAKAINKLARIFHPIAIPQIHAAGMCGSTSEKRELLKLLNSQMNKALIVHALGISAIALAITSLILAVALCPPLAVLTVGLIGIVFEFPRSVAPTAFLNHEGYRWNVKATLQGCLPSFLITKPHRH